jgi:hypothetical protein
MVVVETGISDDDYLEVISGLEGENAVPRDKKVNLKKRTE